MLWLKSMNSIHQYEMQCDASRIRENASDRPFWEKVAYTANSRPSNIFKAESLRVIITIGCRSAWCYSKACIIFYFLYSQWLVAKKYVHVKYFVFMPQNCTLDPSLEMRTKIYSYFILMLCPLFQTWCSCL